MSGSATSKRAWVEQVLGYRFRRSDPLKTGGGAGQWKAARQAWQTASDTVDGQLSALQSALRQTGDPELIEIAEFGLNAMTANHKTRLLTMLVELGDAGPDIARRTGPKAISLLEEFQAHIESDPRIAACDANPADVPVSIRTTLGPALAGLQAALEAAQAA